MFPPNNSQDFPAAMQEDQNECSIVVRDENGVLPQAQSIIYNSQKLQDDLQILGVKIKQHEGNLKLLKIQKNKLDESILDLQVVLGKYHSSTSTNIASDGHTDNEGEEEIIKKILECEMSAAGILCQLKLHPATQASHLALTKDVLGMVATLGKVDDANLSRLLSEYLGAETMLAIVCKTYKGVRALEAYDKEGNIDRESGLHGLGASIGRVLDGRFVVICLEHLIPYCGEFVPDDPQRKLDLVKPRLQNGDCPPGFIGFAVNMINIEFANLFCLTAYGHGLRETLFYNLFSRLQVYQTRDDMMCAIPCISDGAISLDGGMIKSAGVFSLGKRSDVDIAFPKYSGTPSPSDMCVETEKKLNETKWQKEKILDDINREQELLRSAKTNFEKKKEEFVKFLAVSSSYATQHQFQTAQDRFQHR